MPVRVVLGRGVALRRTAGSQAGRGDHLAGEDGRDVLRRIDGGAALALVGRGFRTGPWRVGRGGTPRLGARGALRGPRTRRVEAQNVHQSRRPSDNSGNSGNSAEGHATTPGAAHSPNCPNSPNPVGGDGAREEG